MKKSVVVAAAALAALVGGVSIAAASGEVAVINYNVKGKFSPKKYKPAKLTFGVNLSAPNPPNITISPMQVADMRFPAKGVMQFTPKKGLPVCKATPTQLSVSPEAAYATCPKAYIGHGEATFQLGQNNSSIAFRKGTVVIFYGGLSGKNVKIKFSAWSGDTNAGVYAEGILKPNGQMKIAMPVLTADSSVTSLNLAIPGTGVNGAFNNGTPYSLKKGLDAGFVKVKCRQGQNLKFASTFTLGSRNSLGQPTGPTSTVSATSSSKCGS